MKYTSPLGEHREMDLTTVVLEYDFNNASSETSLIMWHCPVCRNPVIQFGARMIAILPGLVPSNSPPVISQCLKCKKKYRFMSIVTF